MAKENEDIEVNLEGDDEIVIELEGEEGAAVAAAEAEAEKKEKKAVPRVRLQDANKEPDAVAEATKALSEAEDRVKKAESDAAAANATAAAERQARLAAERQAQQRAREADAATATAETAQLTLLDKGIESATSEVDAYKQQLTTAYEAGDFKVVAEVQAKLSRASATLDRLEADKERLATAPKREVTEGRVEQRGNAVDNYLNQMDAQSQSWLRAHPECLPVELGGDAAAHSKMMKGHHKALSEGFAANTADYFRVIEESTGHRTPVSAAAAVKTAGSEEEETAPPPKKKAQPSAPPSRDVPRADGKQARSNPRSVVLTRDQVEMAKVAFPHIPEKEALAQYARNLIELEAEGKMGRLTH